jgi:hypothetical protein
MATVADRTDGALTVDGSRVSVHDLTCCRFCTTRF